MREWTTTVVLRGLLLVLMLMLVLLGAPFLIRLVLQLAYFGLVL